MRSYSQVTHAAIIPLWQDVSTSTRVLLFAAQFAMSRRNMRHKVEKVAYPSIHSGVPTAYQDRCEVPATMYARRTNKMGPNSKQNGAHPRRAGDR